MTNKKSRRGRPKLSPALRQAVAADRIGCFVDNPVLDKSDVVLLKKLLAGDGTADPEISLTRALGALARSDKTAETGELLGRVLADPKAPQRERAAAAASLALLPAEAAEQPLLAALPKSHGPLRFEVIQALGQVGTGKALARLRKLDLAEEDAARRQLSLAELAIAFREGRGKTGPDELAAKLGLSWNTIDARRLEPKAVGQTLAALGGPAYGVPLRSDIALRFDCGRLQNVVLLNQALVPGSFVRNAREASMVAGLVAAQTDKLAYFTVRWLLLTSPEADGVRMVMVRPNGDPVFEGRAVDEGEGLRFTMRDTGLERTPTEISGRVTDDDISWTIRVWRGPLREKQRPRAIPGVLAAPAG